MIRVLVILLFICSPAFASTTVDYRSKCEYRNSDGKPVFVGQCQVNWGIVGPGSCEPDKFLERYILDFSQNSSAVIYLRCDGTGLVNDIGAVAVKKSGSVSITTSEGETFKFEETEDR